MVRRAARTASAALTLGLATLPAFAREPVRVTTLAQAVAGPAG